MRWLLIALLTSVGALLFAVAGTARHVLLHRTKQRRDSMAGHPTTTDTREDTDLESES
jgi:hypothetical protein